MAVNQQLIEARCTFPFEVLGKRTQDKTTNITAWLPAAQQVEVLKLGKTKKAKPKSLGLMTEASSGLFEFECAASKLSDEDIYTLKATYPEGEHTAIDPYQFQSEAYHAVHYVDHAPENLYQQIGAQLVEINGIQGTRFAVFAPNASSVSLIASFNYWDASKHPMQKTELGYWVLFVPEIGAGETYKFAIKDAHGHALPDKQDPLGFHHHQYPSHCSVVYDHNQYQWKDSAWQTRKNHKPYEQAMSIYEVHLGSWRKPGDENQRYLSYQDLSQQLVDYVKEMGYTHIEVLPVSEFPFDGSWGYQPVGLFAPTSRFGDPDAFKAFVDMCHQASIGVIIDWVPAHFPEDGHGLARFDGSHLYEYEDPKKGWHPDWNSCIYDFGKDTVRQFLVANALYWFDKFHVDAIRVDAVASMLYLDYSRNDGEWIPNVDGGNHNYEAISLLQWMNTEVYAKFPNAMTIAEESTSFAGVSKPVDQGGLGFGFKWNMGWMHDSLHYIAKDPAYRRYHHGELSFSMVYAYDENFVLPISHDEVVHGKGSMLQKMPGDDWQRFANLRAYYGFMFAHPGKKLQFMGNEFAQNKEWNHDISLDWHLLDDSNAKHAGIQRLYKSLNHLYTSQPALHVNDHQAEGFQWIDHNNAEQSVFSFLRKGANETVLVICNFTPIPQDGFRVGVNEAGTYELLFNTDKGEFGGSDYPVVDSVDAQAIAWNDQNHSVLINLPPLSVIFYKVIS
jgi:1,4-alpha-glucan branching enzyme